MKTLSLIAAASVVAFANTNAGGRFYISATAQNSVLAEDDFEALTWIEVKNVGSIGETGENTNIVTYDTWDTGVIQKGKGITDAGSPEIEVARVPDDLGQIAVRAAAKTNLNYATKQVMNDPKTLGGTGTTYYNRGLVTGPRRPNGRNEDFQLEIYTFALQQVEIVVDPT